MNTPKTERLQMPRVILSAEQARTFALSIAGDIRGYVDAHRAEFDKWLMSQSEELSSCQPRSLGCDLEARRVV